MHESVMEYVAGAIERYGLKDLRTLELGASNVNGSVRPLFSGGYIGIDHDPSSVGIDQYMSSHSLKFDEASFDTVVTVSMLEHDPAFWLTLSEVSRVLKPGGHLILTTVSTGFGYHNPPDYWRFEMDTVPILAEMAGCTVLDARADPQVAGIQFTAQRQ
jgi:SAM-dependent methyltransferase